MSHSPIWIPDPQAAIDWGVDMRIVRESHRWSQERLAKSTGLDRDTIANLERGFGWTKIVRVCAVFEAMDATVRVYPGTLLKGLLREQNYPRALTD